MTFKKSVAKEHRRKRGAVGGLGLGVKAEQSRKIFAARDSAAIGFNMAARRSPCFYLSPKAGIGSRSHGIVSPSAL